MANFNSNDIQQLASTVNPSLAIPNYVFQNNDIKKLYDLLSTGTGSSTLADVLLNNNLTNEIPIKSNNSRSRINVFNNLLYLAYENGMINGRLIADDNRLKAEHSAEILLQSLKTIITGNLGVGTSDPILPLQVVGSALIDGVRSGDIGLGNYSFWGALSNEIQTNFNGTGKHLILQHSNGGNVGIGVINPTSKLELSGSTSANNQFRLNEGSFTGTNVNGDISNELSNKSLNAFTGKGIREKIQTTIWTQFLNSNSTTIAITPTSILTTDNTRFLGSRIIPGSFWAIGNTIEIEAEGIISKSVASENMAVNISIGGVFLGVNGILSTLGGAIFSNRKWTFKAKILCTSLTTLRATAEFLVNNTANTYIPIDVPMVNVASAPTGLIDVVFGGSNNGYSVTTNYAQINLK